MTTATRTLPCLAGSSCVMMIAVVFEDQGVSLSGTQRFANGLICLCIMPQQVEKTRYVSVIPNIDLKLSPGPAVETC